jgi:hypothetical protein
MNEDPGYPERWYKLRDRNDKGGGWLWFVLIIIFAVVITIVVETDSCEKDRHPYSGVYNLNKNEIQNAVTGYATDHNGSLPTLNGIYSNANCSNCSVINISAVLVANGGLLRTYPDGLHLGASDNDNCSGNASLGCSSESNYIWIVNTEGQVFSYCAGAGCTTNNSGYQDVWP